MIVTLIIHSKTQLLPVVATSASCAAVVVITDV